MCSILYFYTTGARAGPRKDRQQKFFAAEDWLHVAPYRGVSRSFSVENQYRLVLVLHDEPAETQEGEGPCIQFTDFIHLVLLVFFV